jgi:hypothetical protein
MPRDTSVGTMALVRSGWDCTMQPACVVVVFVVMEVVVAVVVVMVQILVVAAKMMMRMMMGRGAASAKLGNRCCEKNTTNDSLARSHTHKLRKHARNATCNAS